VRFAVYVAVGAAFSWRMTVEPGRVRLVIIGEVDVAAHEELLKVVATVPDMGRPLVVDLGGVTFVDGSGISALMALTQAAVDRGIAVGFTDRPTIVDRVLDLTDTSLASLEVPTARES